MVIDDRRRPYELLDKWSSRGTDKCLFVVNFHPHKHMGRITYLYSWWGRKVACNAESMELSRYGNCFRRTDYLQLPFQVLRYSFLDVCPSLHFNADGSISDVVARFLAVHGCKSTNWTKQNQPKFEHRISYSNESKITAFANGQLSTEFAPHWVSNFCLLKSEY